MVLPLVFGISALGTGNVFEALIFLAQIIFSGFTYALTKYPVNVIGFTSLFLTTVLLSVAISGIFFSLSVKLHNRKGNFNEGVKKYFLRVFKAIIFSILGGIVILLSFLIIALPAIVFTRTVMVSKETIDPGLLASLILVNLTTLFILLYQFFTLFMKFSFWFPSMYSFDRNSYSVAKTVVNIDFWANMKNVFLFFLNLLLFEFVLISVGFVLNRLGMYNTFGVFIFVFLNSLIKALLTSVFIIRVFESFNQKKSLVY